MMVRARHGVTWHWLCIARVRLLQCADSGSSAAAAAPFKGMILNR
jgi:hypothetical protein